MLAQTREQLSVTQVWVEGGCKDVTTECSILPCDGKAIMIQ